MSELSRLRTANRYLGRANRKLTIRVDALEAENHRLRAAVKRPPRRAANKPKPVASPKTRPSTKRRRPTKHMPTALEIITTWLTDHPDQPIAAIVTGTGLTEAGVRAAIKNHKGRLTARLAPEHKRRGAKGPPPRAYSVS